MKKLIVVLCVLAMLVVDLGAASYEGWTSLGTTYEASFGFGSDPVAIDQSVGMPVNTYAFWNGSNIGLYVGGNLMAPLYLSGRTVPLSCKDWGFGIKATLMVGLGIQVPLNEQAGLHVAVGPTVGEMFLQFAVGKTMMSVDFGIGADIGCKLYLTDLVALDAGVTVVGNYASWFYDTTTSPQGSGFVPGYFGLDVRPYVCCAFNFSRV